MVQVTVKKWEQQWDGYDDDKCAYKSYHIGHSVHGGQILVYGSEDLVDQLISILNSSQITYNCDKTREGNSKQIKTKPTEASPPTLQGKPLEGRDDVIQELAQAIMSLSYDNFDQAVKEIRNSYEKAVMLRAGLSTTELASRKM